MNLSEINNELLRNEIRKISVDLRNVGSFPLHKIYIATSTPHLISYYEFCKDNSIVEESEMETASVKEKEARKNHVKCVPLENNQLDPGQCKNISLWIMAPDVVGPAYIDLLIYYENMNPTNVPRYEIRKS